MIKLKDQLTGMFRLNFSGNPLKLLVLADWDYHPFRTELISSLNQKDINIQFHVWKKAEIENYLLVRDALDRLVRLRNEDRSLFSHAFNNVFDSLLDRSRDIVEEKISKAVEDYSYAEKKRLGYCEKKP